MFVKRHRNPPSRLGTVPWGNPKLGVCPLSPKGDGADPDLIHCRQCRYQPPRQATRPLLEPFGLGRYAPNFGGPDPPLPVGGARPPSDTMCLGSPQVFTPNGISIRSAVFAQYTRVTDRRTDGQVTPRDHRSQYTALPLWQCRIKTGRNIFRRGAFKKI